jgi:hypothetical protein
MSPLAATLIALALYVIGFAPVAWIVRPGMEAKGPGMAFAAAILVLGVFQTGVFARGSLTSTSIARLVPDQSTLGRCRQVIDVATQAGIVLDAAQPGKMTVKGTIWQQVPSEVRDAIASCAAQLAPKPEGYLPSETAGSPDAAESTGVEIILR